jgi:hypothetical protein
MTAQFDKAMYDSSYDLAEPEKAKVSLPLNSIKFITGCEFQARQNTRRLNNVYAINFMP